MSASPHIEAHIAGNVTGQVAVGSYIIQNNVDHGGVVFVAAPGETPIPRLRPLPIRLGGRVPAIVGRRNELASIEAALGPSAPVEVHGRPGIGKTALLKVVIGSQGDHEADGSIVYHSAIGEPVSDTLQFLFDAFYECSVPFKPADAQIRLALGTIRGLVVIDDISWDRNEADALLDAVPLVAVLCASTQQCLWGTGTAMAVSGLSDEDAVALLSREMGRPLLAEETEAVRSLTAAVDREPLAVLHLASLIHTVGHHLASVADDLHGASPLGDEVARRLSASLSDDERLVLDALEAAAGAALTATHLTILTGLPAVQPCIDALIALRLAQAHSPRYSATRAAPPGAPALNASIACLGECGDDVEQVVELAGAIVLSIRSAVARNDWEGVLSVGRLSESGLILGRRWGAWAESLEAQRQAAEALQRPHDEAWALHQLGTRALCLDDPAAAEILLTRALELRQALGDEPGAEATRHNLNLLRDVSSGAPEAGKSPVWMSSFRRRLILVAVVGVALMLLLAWAVTRSTGTPPPAPIQARLSALDADVDFGSVPVGGGGSSRSVRLRNEGSQSLRGVRLLVVGPQGGDFVVGTSTCQAAVPAGATCSVEVAFSPAAAGPRRAVLRVEADLRPLAQLSGQGIEATVPAASARVEQTSLDFAEAPLLTPSAPQAVQVANTGLAPLLVTVVEVEGDDRGDFVVAGDCAGLAVPPGGACSVQVVFSPTAPGSRRARLAIRFSGADPGFVELTGVGVEERVGEPEPAPAPVSQPPTPVGPGQEPIPDPAPAPPFLDLVADDPPDPPDTDPPDTVVPAVLSVAADPTTLDFGSQLVGSASEPRAFRLSSQGTVDPEVVSVGLTGPDAGDYLILADGCTEAGAIPADGCAVTVAFTPSSIGLRIASVEVSLAGDFSVSVALTGEGAARVEVPAPTLLVLDQSLDFGTVRIGSSRSKASAIVMNPGGSTSTVPEVAVEGASDFAVEEVLCVPGAQVLQGGVCVIILRFTPVEPGPRLGAVVIGPPQPTPATVALHGIGEVPPNGGRGGVGAPGLSSVETGESDG